MIDRLADSLSNQISCCFGVPGSGKSGQLLSLLGDHGIDFYSCNHEGAAAIMAGAYGEVNKISGCISIKGPGLVNMLSGLANNYFEDRKTISFAENFDIGVAGSHKKIDHSIVHSVAKYVTSLQNNDGFDDLSSIASRNRPGVVHVELTNNPCNDKPEDMQSTPDDDIVYVPYNTAIILGQKCKRDYIQLDHLKIPVFSTASAKGVVDETLSMSGGVYCGVGLINEDVLKQADLILGVEIQDHEVLRVDSRIKHISLKTFLDLLPRLENKDWGISYLQKYNNTIDALGKGWSPLECFRLLSHLDTDYDLVVDTGLFCVASEYGWKARRNRRYFGSLNSRFMGTSIPTAIGISLGSAKPVICAMGDGGMSYISELSMVRSRSLPICFISFLNGRYASLGNSLPESIVIKNNSWRTVFESFGMPSYSCSNISQFITVLDTWDYHSPMYIECTFDKDEYIVSGLRL